MNLNNDIISLDLIEGGRVIRQGDHFSIAVVPRDSKGAAVDLTGKTIEVDLLDKRGIVYETTAEFDTSKEAVRFSVTGNIGYGEMQMEFTATDPNDPTYRRKFPASDFDGRLQFNRSGDALEYAGVRMVTVEQLRKEQRDAQTEYEVKIDQKVQQIGNDLALEVDKKLEEVDTALLETEQERQAIRQEFDEYFTEFGESVAAETAIYGVYSDGSSSPVMQRIKSASGLTAAIGVSGEYVVNDFDMAQIFGEIGDVVDDLGNAYTRVPTHYFRHREGVHPNGEVWTIDEISKTQHAGFERYPHFWDFENQRELPYVDIGKYLAGYDESNRMTSKKGVYPQVSQNIEQFRNAARANNADGRKGYQLIDIHVIDMLQRLFVIEFATTHSQSVMYGFATGEYSEAHVTVLEEAAANRVVMATSYTDSYRIGQSIGIGTSRGGNQITPYRTITEIEPVDDTNSALVFDGEPLDILAGYQVYNTAYRTGTTDNVAASSGSMISTTDGKHQMKYRGIESLYGDLYQFVDGINMNDWQAWVTDNAEDYASNVFAAPYKQLGYVNSEESGYIKTLGYDSDNPTVRLPVTVGAGSATWYSDYYYQNPGQRVALFGGSWYNGAYVGLFLWNLSYSSSSSYLLFGSRLLKKTL